MANPFVSDGDYSDLTLNTTIYPEGKATWTSDPATIYGHTDGSNDWDYGNVYVTNSGWYSILSSGTSLAYVYDATAGTMTIGPEIYITAGHTNYLEVNSFVDGESYSVNLKPSTLSHVTQAYDGDSSDLTTSKYVCPAYSGYQTATGHTDSYGDWDYGAIFLNVGQSGYYDIFTTGSTAAYFYDATAGTWLSGSQHVYLDETHYNYFGVIGYSTGQTYTVTIK